MDPIRFEALVNEHKDAVYRQMMRVCNHQEDAEDALAEALLLAFKASDQLGSDAAFRTWLGTIGKRVCLRMRSRPSMQETVEYAEARDLIATDVTEFDVAMMKGCVMNALAALPDKYRDVYRLCELEEVTLPEAAERLEISVAAAKSRLLRAREAVRAHLGHSICGV